MDAVWILDKRIVKLENLRHACTVILRNLRKRITRFYGNVLLLQRLYLMEVFKMNIVEMREKRANLWKGMESFLDSRRDAQGCLSAEDDATYSRMEADLNSMTNKREAYPNFTLLSMLKSVPFSRSNSARALFISDSLRNSFSASSSPRCV